MEKTSKIILFTVLGVAAAGGLTWALWPKKDDQPSAPSNATTPDPSPPTSPPDSGNSTSKMVVPTAPTTPTSSTGAGVVKRGGGLPDPSLNPANSAIPLTADQIFDTAIRKVKDGIWNNRLKRGAPTQQGWPQLHRQKLIELVDSMGKDPNWKKSLMDKALKSNQDIGTVIYDDAVWLLKNPK